MRSKLLSFAGASALAFVAVPASADTIAWNPQSTDTASVSDFDTASQTFTGVTADSITFSGDGYFHNHGGTGGFNIYAIVNGSTQTIFTYAGGVPTDVYFHNHGGTGGFNIYAIVNGSTQTIFTYAGGVPTDLYYLSGLGTIGFGGGTVTGIQISSTQFVGNAFHAFGNESFTLNVSAAVPEPGTWAMMLLGFGAIGVAMRRRKPTAVALPQVA